MKIKLFYAPELNINKPPYLKEPARFPLISLPVIKSFLEQYGFKVKQDDLDIKVFFDNKYTNNEKKKIDMSMFDDKTRIKRFIETKQDEVLEDNARRILKKTVYKNFDLIGFSFSNCWTFASMGVAVVLSKVIKEETGSLIALGGSRFEKTIVGVPFKEVGFVDFFCLASNHHVFARLLNFLDNGKMPDKKTVPDIIYNDRKIKKYLEIKKCRSYKIREIPHEYYTSDVFFPMPNFDGMPLDLYKYIPTDVKENKLSNKKILILPYYFVDGCPNNCIFCKDSYSDKIIVKKPELVTEELKKLSKKYRTKHFMFTNTSINPTKDYANKLAEEIIKQDLDIGWFDCATFKFMDKKLLIKLQKAGAKRLLYGLECASPRMQKYLEKNIDLNHAARILKYANKLNIWNEVEMICGLPYETRQDKKNSIRFLYKNRNCIDYFYLTKFYLIPSKLTKYPEKYGIRNIRNKKGDTCEGLAFDETNGLKWDEKKKQIELAFRRYYRFREKTFNKGFDNANLHFYKIFYLYTIFDSKKDIKEYINKNGLKID